MIVFSEFLFFLVIGHQWFFFFGGARFAIVDEQKSVKAGLNLILMMACIQLVNWPIKFENKLIYWDGLTRNGAVNRLHATKSS